MQYSNQNFDNDAGMKRPVDPKAFGMRLAAKLAELGMTQPELARRVGITQQTISGYVQGKTKRPGMINEIAAKLGTTADYLLYGDPEPPRGGLTMTAENIEAASWQDEKPSASAQLRVATFSTPVPQVPIRGHGMGGKDGCFIMDADAELGSVEGSVSLIGVPGAYAVYVRGDSMGQLRSGSLVLVDPRKPPRAGDICVIQRQAEDGTVHGWVKEFVSMDDAVLVVRQYNPPKTIKWPANTVKSVHKVVEARYP